MTWMLTGNGTDECWCGHGRGMHEPIMTGQMPCQFVGCTCNRFELRRRLAVVNDQDRLMR